MKIGSILVLAILAASITLCAAIEYKTLENDYYRVEYPVDWKVEEQKGSVLKYDFIIPHNESGRMVSVRGEVSIIVGLNGAAMSLRILPDPYLQESMYSKDGSINESILHFLETFKPKKTPTL